MIEQIKQELLEKDTEEARELHKMIEAGTVKWMVSDVQDTANEGWSWFSQEIHESEHEIEDELAGFGSTEWKEENWHQRMTHFQFVCRFLFLGLPWLFLDTVFQVVNILVNTLANHFWGDGNVILIANTLISLYQGLFSFLLILQLPEYMQHMKMARGFSYLLAISYNLFYVWSGLEAWNGSKNAQ